jgi:hypothetical protein
VPAALGTAIVAVPLFKNVRRASMPTLPPGSDETADEFFSIPFFSIPSFSYPLEEYD